MVERFKDEADIEYLVGDRAPIGRRSVRRVALAHPEWFAMEFETAPLDVAWLQGLNAEFDREYKQVKARRDRASTVEERALREELRDQDRAQPELERRYEKQVQAGEKREKARREATQREEIENEIALGRQRTTTSGFHSTL